jgi:hypothetical protein
VLKEKRKAKMIVDHIALYLKKHESTAALVKTTLPRTPPESRRPRKTLGQKGLARGRGKSKTGF